MGTIYKGTQRIMPTINLGGSVSPLTLYWKKDVNNKIVFDSRIIDIANATSVGQYGLYYVYYNNQDITGNVDFSSLINIDNTNVQACHSAFESCHNITSVDLSSLQAIGGSQACYNMFYDCTGLTSVDLSSLTNLTNSNVCTSMFQNCTSLTSVDLSSLDFTNYYNTATCQYMFKGCTSLTNINFPSMATINGQMACNYMFENCTGLISASFPVLTTIRGANSCNHMFAGCTNLTTVDLSHVTNIYDQMSCANMFLNGNITGHLNLGSLTKVWGSSSCANMFMDHYNITSVDLHSFKEVAGQTGCQFMFKGCYGITGTLSLPEFINISGSSGCSGMFQDCTGLTSVELSNLQHINANSACQRMFQGCTNIVSASFYQTSPHTNGLINIYGPSGCYQMFAGCTNLTTVDLQYLNTIGYNNSTLTGASACANMFDGCTSLSNVIFANDNTPDNQNRFLTINSTSACQYMFKGCTSLTSIDLSHLTSVIYGSSSNPRNTALGYMFYDCSALTDIDLSRLYRANQNKVFKNTFYGCTSLRTVKFYSLTDMVPPTNANTSIFFDGTFIRCHDVDIYFYNLDPESFGTVTSTTNNKQFRGGNTSSEQGIFTQATNCTLHFPSNMQSIIEMMNGYSVTNGFDSPTNANNTVLFDLPATSTLTGSNSIDYKRHPRRDTANSLAWRRKTNTDVQTWDNNMVYTSGITDPQVGDHFYSDAACQTQLTTTISSIA